MTVGSCTPVPEEYLPVEAKGEAREMVLWLCGAGRYLGG